MRKSIVLIILSLFLLNIGSCPTGPEEEGETAESPPAFPEVPPPDEAREK